jgi:DNA repair exonuclease SbcCD nuclease subunit
MNLKILVIGDNHFTTSNIEETQKFIIKIKDLVLTSNLDFIVVLGDILHEHERIHTLPLNKAYEFLDELRKLVLTFVLVGNHDMINHRQFMTENHWMNGLKKWENIVIVDKAISYRIKEHLFCFCPYVPNGRFIEALTTISNENWKQSTCIFAHQEFYGCKMGAIESIDGDKWDKDLPNVISGHIHVKQTIENIYYTGSSMQCAFGEPDKIVALIEFSDNKTYQKSEIKLNLPKKRIIYADIDDIDSLEIKETEDTIKLSISGTYEEFKIFKKSKKYKEIMKNGTKIIYKAKKNKSDLNEKSEDFTGNFNEILHNLVLKSGNMDLISDFNYIFLKRKKNEEIFLI